MHNECTLSVQQKICAAAQINLGSVHTQYYKVCMAQAKKRAHERAVRTTVTFPPTLMSAAEQILSAAGFSGLSDYLQDLARKDINTRNPQLLAAR